MVPALMRSVMVLTADTSFFSDFLHAYTPRRICMNSESAVIWLSVLSDGLIALSYFSIPLALLVFVKRRRDLAFNWMFLLFASFIFACGATHAMGVWAIWQPLYKLDGTVKLATGLLSAATAVLLWRLIPTLVRLPSPSDLAQANATLTQLRDELEQRVEMRTRELAEAGERERVARGDAVRANRAKDEFLATLSHELRTPLHSIVGWTEVMSQVNLDEQERERAISVIRRNAAIQAQLIEDMLDLSRITSGKLRLDVRDVDLKSVVHAARETIEPAAAAKGIHVRVPHLDSCPWRGDPDRLQQAVWNLLSNAVKFTPQGGEVTVGLELADSEIVISVSDTGPGLQPDIQPFVFDRFRQGDSSASRKHGGLGLGLAIVRHIVELHGGTAHAGQAKSGSGAMFSIRLPKQARLAEAQASQGPAVVQARSAAARPLPSATLLENVRVLVVDDELDPQALARMVLEQHGATVTTASSAAEARAALDRGAFDVLVSDIGMPGEDGFSLLRTIRKRPAAAGGAIPALALTAFARAKDRQDAIDVGFQEYLSKPVELTELLWAIARLIGRAGEGAD